MPVYVWASLCVWVSARPKNIWGRIFSRWGNKILRRDWGWRQFAIVISALSIALERLSWKGMAPACSWQRRPRCICHLGFSVHAWKWYFSTSLWNTAVYRISHMPLLMLSMRLLMSSSTPMGLAGCLKNHNPAFIGSNILLWTLLWWTMLWVLPLFSTSVFSIFIAPNSTTLLRRGEEPIHTMLLLFIWSMAF